MKTGVSSSRIININKQRAKKGIAPIKCNCGTCLYFNDKQCKFKRNTTNRRYCIRYEYAKPNPSRKPQKKSESVVIPPTLVIKKTTFEYLSDFFGVIVTRDNLSKRCRCQRYKNGYSMKIRSKTPLVIALQHNLTGQLSYYEVVK